VVITHAHHDHIVLETLIQLRSRIGRILVPRCSGGTLQDPSMKMVLEQIGFERVTEVEEMQEIVVPGGQITAIPFFGEHCDLDIRSKSTYLVALEGYRCLVAADSSGLNPSVYENVHRCTGDIDVLFLGLECTGAPLSWAYGPLFCKPLDKKLDQARRSNGSDYTTGMSMIDIFNPRAVYLYAMGAEPWLNYFMALQHGHNENANEATHQVIESCSQRGIRAEKLFACKELLFSRAPVTA
jgi:L-ascorbate metabolism protein UlaG (beta-lactamase superfamily)